MGEKLSYENLINYGVADPAKVFAQHQAARTTGNLPFGFTEAEGTRGESAYVFDMGSMYGALVQEGLGTKSLVAQSVYRETGESYFGVVAKDTVATIVNDLVSVGATPAVINAYWSAGDYSWLSDPTLTTDFIEGWRLACDQAQITWGGGETQSLPGIVQEGSLEFAGSAFGVIKDEKRLVSDAKIRAGDAVILIESNGVHANGITLVREVAKNLDESYRTLLPDGTPFGEAVLKPSHLYTKAINNLFETCTEIHYLSHITGHGWRKLMRGRPELTYRMHAIPPVAPVFDFIAHEADNDNTEMYATYNMGAGFAAYVRGDEASYAVNAINAAGLEAWNAGTVEEGPRQVIIEPLNIVYSGTKLQVRK